MRFARLWLGPRVGPPRANPGLEDVIPLGYFKDERRVRREIERLVEHDVGSIEMGFESDDWHELSLLWRCASGCASRKCGQPCG